MTLDRPLILSLALVAAACGDNGTATTATDSSTSTASGTTGDATTNDPTTPPTTDAPTTGDASSTIGTTVGPTSDASTTDAPATTTGDSSTDALTSSTTGEQTTGSTGAIDETTSSTGSDTTGSTGADTSSTGDTMGADDDSIYEIQNGTIKEKEPVDVKGVIVTGISATKTGMFVQEKDGGQYSGAWVYVGKMGPNIMALALGDEVDITGTILEFNDLTEIDASLGTVTPTGVKGVKIDPAPVTLKTLADPMTAEPWEAVHVRVTGAPLTITQIINLVEYKLTSAGEGVVVDDLLYASLMDKPSFPQIGVDASFTAAAGPLNQSVGVYKIAPRVPADLEGYKPPPNPKLGVEDLKAGDLVISEVMYNPTCNNDDCEWIEVYNAAAQPIDLLGLIIQDDAQDKNKQGKVTVSAVVDPGKFAVLGFKTMVSWPYPNPPAAFYGANPALGNSGDQVFLKNTTITIDGMPAWGNQPNNSGHSFKLDPNKLNAVDNDVLANWCYSAVLFYMNTEWGSPGAVNELACAVL